MKRLIYVMLLVVILAVAAVPTAIAGTDEMLVCEQQTKCTTNCDGGDGGCRVYVYCITIFGVGVWCWSEVICG